MSTLSPQAETEHKVLAAIVERFALSEHPLSETPAVNATLIVIDPGSSLFKIISSGRSGNPEPLALRPEIVSGMTTAQAEV